MHHSKNQTIINYTSCGDIYFHKTTINIEKFSLTLLD